jgi:two-component system, cell cycle response regulator DivK
MGRILIVEDDPMLLDLLARILRRAGYATLITANGAEGIVCAQQQQPDLILMDLVLPVLNGWDAIGQLKASPCTANIPVLALSACLSEDDKARAIAVGCDGWISKPFQIQAFLEQVAGAAGAT